MVDAPEHWQSWALTRSDVTAAGPWRWDTDRAELPVEPGGRAVIDRPSSSTVLHGVQELDDAWLHPQLGTTALAAGAWRGQLGLHAGVIAHAGRAWGLLGDRGAGKSSALMWWLANAGTVLADDLLLTDGQVVLAGPRFIDLRAGAAQRYGTGSDVGVLGTRRRWRVPTGPADPETALGGFVELAWGDDLHVDPVPVNERLDLLATHRGLRFPVDDQTAALAALARPMLRFTRPKTWETVDEVMQHLVSHLDGYG